MKLARPRSAEWQGEIAVSRTSAHFSDAKDTLADRSDLIAELKRQLQAAGMLASRERLSAHQRLSFQHLLNR